MGKKHLKRYATPKTWSIKKKGITFVARPNPGAHTRDLSMPICVLLKEFLKCAKTTKEVKKLLHSNEVLVDQRRVTDYRFPAGLMDVITLTPTKSNYRIVFDEKGRLKPVEIDAKEAKVKLCQVRKKTAIKGGKIQLNLSDSRNIILQKNEYGIGDSLLIELPSQKILGQFKLEKGASVMLISGKHIAEQGVVESAEGRNILFNSTKGHPITTLKSYAFVTGKSKPEVKVN